LLVARVALGLVFELCEMPRVTWHGSDGEMTNEEGPVKVLAKFLFVNGTKRRKLTDMGDAPKRGEPGQLLLRFGADDWCDMRFEKRDQCSEFESTLLNATGKTTAPSVTGGASVRRGLTLTNAAAAENSVLPRDWEESIREAIAGAHRNNRFENPLLAGGLEGTTPVARLLADLCVAWQALDERRDESDAAKRAVLDEERSLKRQLEQDCRDIDVKLHDANANIAELQKTRGFLEREMGALKLRLQEQRTEAESAAKVRFLETEVAGLRERLKGYVKYGAQFPATPEKLSLTCQPVATQATAQSIAELECSPLQAVCDSADREALKRRLLLKWHPDKQPSAAHAELATKVMQELQTTKAWRA